MSEECRLKRYAQRLGAFKGKHTQVEGPASRDISFYVCEATELIILTGNERPRSVVRLT